MNIIFVNFLVALASAEVQKFISGNNKFMGDIYKEIAKTDQKNILVSPMSAEVVLSLARAGAKGETGEELSAALHLSNIKEETESAIKTILPSLQSAQNSSVHIANKIYLKEDITLKDQFRNVAIEIYQSDLENINFEQKQQAAATMNKWVEEHTNNKIHDLISPDDLDPRTAAILINALYFKGNWQNPFSNYSTTKQKFYKTPQDVAEIDMMHSYEQFFNYYEDTKLNAKFLELPFEGSNISMTFVLPNEKDGISALDNQIDQIFAERQYSSEYLNVAIPKFKIETKIDFKEILLNLGVKKAFDSSQADFSDITNQKLWIDKVRQKTFIDVNEIGVEAAAASFVGFLLESAMLDTPKEFVADHPFIFYIKSGNLILFGGKLSTPDSTPGPEQ